MEMMTHKHLAAMATLDYNVISDGWKGTMPNQGLIEELLNNSKGRLMVMNTDGLFFDARKTRPLKAEIVKARKRMSAAEKKAFVSASKESKLSIDFQVKG